MSRGSSRCKPCEAAANGVKMSSSTAAKSSSDSEALQYSRCCTRGRKVQARGSGSIQAGRCQVVVGVAAGSSDEESLKEGVLLVEEAVLAVELRW